MAQLLTAFKLQPSEFWAMSLRDVNAIFEVIENSKYDSPESAFGFGG